MEHAQMLHVCHLRHLHADDVAGVPPVLLHRHRVQQRVHGVEDDQVRIAEELDEATGFARVFELVLGIGRVHHDFPIAFEAVAVGVAGVPLQLRRDFESGNVVTGAGPELHEFDIGGEPGKIHREAGRRLLQPERLLEHVVTAMDTDARPRNIGGGEEGKSHDMVPVQVGHDHVDDRRRRMDGTRQEDAARDDADTTGARALTCSAKIALPSLAMVTAICVGLSTTYGGES